MVISMSDSLRITNHPILGPEEPAKEVTIYYEGQPVTAKEGEPIAVALMNAGLRTFHHTEKTKEPRGLYCGMGRCGECRMIVDGVPNVRTCVTLVKDGMRIEVQHGLA